MPQRVISDDSIAMNALGRGDLPPRSALRRESQPSSGGTAQVLERTMLGILAHPSLSWDGLLRDVAAERSLEEDLVIVPLSVARPRPVDGPMVDVLPRAVHEIRNALSPIPYSLALLQARPGNVELERQVASAITSQVEQLAHMLDALEAGGEQLETAVVARSPAKANVLENDRRWSLRIAIDMPLNASVSQSPASSPRSRAR